MTMHTLSLKQLEKNAVDGAFKFEREKASEIFDDERGPALMQLTADEIETVLDAVMPRRTEEIHIWRIVKWMQDPANCTEFDYSNTLFDWCCYPHDESELRRLLSDYGDAEGLQITHILWFNIRDWLRSEIEAALNGETLASEVEKRAALHRARWEQYQA